MIEREAAGGVAAIFEVIGAVTVSAIIERVVVVLLAVNFAPAIAMVLLGRATLVVRVRWGVSFFGGHVRVVRKLATAVAVRVPMRVAEMMVFAVTEITVLKLASSFRLPVEGEIMVTVVTLVFVVRVALEGRSFFYGYVALVVDTQSFESLFNTVHWGVDSILGCIDDDISSCDGYYRTFRLECEAFMSWMSQLMTAPRLLLRCEGKL